MIAALDERFLAALARLRRMAVEAESLEAVLAAAAGEFERPLGLVDSAGRVAACAPAEAGPHVALAVTNRRPYHRAPGWLVLPLAGKTVPLNHLVVGARPPVRYAERAALEL